MLRALIAELPARRFPLPRRHRAPALRHQEPGDGGALLGARGRSAGGARHQGAGRRLQHRVGHRRCPRCASDFPTLPVIGVIEPGARAACEASASGRIAVLATEGTVQGGAYERAIQALRPDAHVTQVACQIFVALAEEGWSEGEAVDAVTRALSRAPRCAHRYRGARLHALSAACRRDRRVSWASRRRVVDSAATTARATAHELGDARAGGAVARARARCALATDSPERFARVGARFLGSSIAAAGGRSDRSLDTFHKAVTLGAPTRAGNENKGRS